MIEMGVREEGLMGSSENTSFLFKAVSISCTLHAMGVLGANNMQKAG